MKYALYFQNTGLVNVYNATTTQRRTGTFLEEVAAKSPAQAVQKFLGDKHDWDVYDEKPVAHGEWQVSYVRKLT